MKKIFLIIYSKPKRFLIDIRTGMLTLNVFIYIKCFLQETIGKICV